MRTDVLYQLPATCECLWTQLATVRSVTCVHPEMKPQSLLDRKRLLAEIADEHVRVLCNRRMLREHVVLERTVLAKGALAYCALIWSFVSVNELVFAQVVVAQKVLLAQVAFVLAQLLFFGICHLIKWQCVD